MDKIPTLRAEIILQEVGSCQEGREAVLVLPDKNQIKVVNEVGAFILHLIDGKRSVSEIVGAVQREYAADEEQIKQDVISFFEQLAKKEIITWSSSE